MSALIFARMVLVLVLWNGDTSKLEERRYLQPDALCPHENGGDVSNWGTFTSNETQPERDAYLLTPPFCEQVECVADANFDGTVTVSEYQECAKVEGCASECLEQFKATP